MPEPISPERFAILVERAGLKLTPEQFDEFRQAYYLVERMARTVRRPRDRGQPLADHDALAQRARQTDVVRDGQPDPLPAVA